MNLPIPTHLKEYLSVNDKKSSENKLVAALQCCGDCEFEIEKSYDNCVCVVKATCAKCKKTILVFDNRIHGWDGYVCRLWRENEAGALEVIERKKEKTFSVNLIIRSEGKADFIENACGDDMIEEVGRKFEEWEWVNAFGWIDIDLECFKCKKKFNLISYETM